MKSNKQSVGSGRFQAILVILLILSACAAPVPKQETVLGRDPKTLVLTIYGNPIDIDPASNSEALANIILFNTTEGLVRVNPKNIDEFLPQLAQKWENNNDFTEWKFYLREDAKFHNGTPVNAEAVKYSFTRLINSSLAYSFILGQFISDPDRQIIVADEFVVEFKFDQPVPLLLKALSSSFGTLVVSPTVESHAVNGDFGHEWLQINEAGSGPYQLAEWTPNQQIVLTRFDGWWGWANREIEPFDKIIMKIVPERSSRRSLIENGDVDIAFDFGPEDWTAIKNNPNLNLQLSESLAVQYIAFGDYGPLDDSRVRQAIAYAFDYDGYIQEIWGGYIPRANSVFPKNLTCYDPSIVPYKTDLEKAKQLLIDAGITDELELRYMTTGDRLEGMVGQILQSQLAKINIKLNIEQRDVASYFSIAFGDSVWPDRPELMALAYWPDYNDPTDFAFYNFATAAGGSGGGNIGLYSNARVDEILSQSVSIIDTKELCNLYKEAQDILLHQDPAWIPLLELPNEAVLRKDIGGYQSNPVYHNMFDFQSLYRISN